MHPRNLSAEAFECNIAFKNALRGLSSYQALCSMGPSFPSLKISLSSFSFLWQTIWKKSVEKTVVSLGQTYQ